MPIGNEDIQLFQIIYAHNADKPMEFIQGEVLKAKQALLENNRILEARAAAAENAAKDKTPHYVELKKSDFVLKTRVEIDAAVEKNAITCCVCGKKMVSLGAHLKRVHHVNPKDYVRVCGYPEGMSLMCGKLLAKARANAEKAQAVRRANRASEK